ncbi:hypothetical protein L0F63_002692 [Massospora cicadina]|nr:hypothetical protein L0F63_002692 [Massospora cicadina]
MISSSFNYEISSHFLQHLNQISSFIDFHPYKGYFDVSFPSEEDAAAAVVTPLIFKNTYIPTT